MSNYPPCVLSLLDCLVPPHTPGYFIPQSEHCQAIRTLIISSVSIQFKPVDIEINLRHPLFLITSLPSPFLFIRYSDSWFLTFVLIPVYDSCLPLVLLPICPCFFDSAHVLTIILPFCLGHYESLSLWLMTFCLEINYFLCICPWSASGSLPET